jgi:hypothetical protein
MKMRTVVSKSEYPSVVLSYRQSKWLCLHVGAADEGLLESARLSGDSILHLTYTSK